MSLDLVHKRLGWPSPEEIRNPSGEGARIFADLAQAKIKRAISSHLDASDVKIGVLLRNSQALDTEAPLAVVAEFNGKASDETLHALQRLAWNFSHSPTVVTIESDLLRVWTCCEPPDKQRTLNEYVVEELATNDLASSHPTDITKRASQTLHWVNLVSGQFFRDHAERFCRDQRADQMLLGNLRHVRSMLHKVGLKNDDICHDLLARIVFVQFLFDRKDTKGNSALNSTKLAALREAGILQNEHPDFPSILGDYEDTYRLFDWLNSKFNGDLFPGKGANSQERERGWSKEREHVKPIHLDLLKEFIKGDMDMPKGQLCLWPQYSFDAIPLEFISSIYETFVTERASGEGIFYTPPHLVDFILDRVLPWDSDKWNLKVLDPSCGSGVFLVKAFQRLIHRWKKAHPGQTIRAENLRGLLEKNLFGVDKDPHAVRVASFSLYLAMCDEIDPKFYWSQVVFPTMREQRLVNSDFFEEDRTGFRTNEDAASYDLVIGNAPWGEKLLTEAAEQWAKDKTHQWPVANKGIGTLFLPKAAALTKPEGTVSIIQSASSLLFNRSGKACDFRKKFFTTFRVDEVVNMSALRFKVFNRKTHSTQTSIAPSCVITFKPQLTDNKRFFYISPKQVEDLADEFDIIIEANDIKKLHPMDAASDPDIWSAFVWGQQRDWVLIKRLRISESLASLEKAERVRSKEGIIWGRNPERQNVHNWLLNRRIQDEDSFPGSSLIYLEADHLPLNNDPVAERPRKESTYSAPQLLIKQGWSVAKKRFQARIIIPDVFGQGALCSQSYLSVCASKGEEALLEAACLSYNSILAVYFLLLTSGRFSTYRPEALASEIPRIPIPKPLARELGGVHTYKDIDVKIREAFELKDAEWVLIEDLCEITLEDFKGDANSPGRKQTQRHVDETNEPELQRYCEYFIRVMKAGFGQDKNITATVFQETGKDLLPYRLVAFELNGVNTEQFSTESLETPDLLAELEALNQTWLSNNKSRGGSIYHQRVARVYDDRGNTPTIFILKPDACRYWTRSMGLHDADEVAADFVSWQSAKKYEHAR
jgi:hypothetical protein